MRCQAVGERMSRYLDDELSSGDRALLEEHLATCPGCSAEHAVQQRLWSLVARLEPVQAPDVFAAVEARLAAPGAMGRRDGGKGLPLFRTLIQVAAAAALIAAFIGTGVWAGNARARASMDGHDRAVGDLLTDTPPGMEVVSLLDEIGERQ